jgi:hypothetical protein
MPGEIMITIANSLSLSKALVIQSILRGSGIEAFIPDELTAQNNWGMINAIGGIRIQIHPEDEQKAREILAGISENNSEEEEEES